MISIISLSLNSSVHLSSNPAASNAIVTIVCDKSSCTPDKIAYNLRRLFFSLCCMCFLSLNLFTIAILKGRNCSNSVGGEEFVKDATLWFVDSVLSSDLSRWSIADSGLFFLGGLFAWGEVGRHTEFGRSMSGSMPFLGGLNAKIPPSSGSHPRNNCLLTFVSLLAYTLFKSECFFFPFRKLLIATFSLLPGSKTVLDKSGTASWSETLAGLSPH